MKTFAIPGNTTIQSAAAKVIRKRREERTIFKKQNKTFHNITLHVHVHATVAFALVVPLSFFLCPTFCRQTNGNIKRV